MSAKKPAAPAKPRPPPFVSWSAEGTMRSSVSVRLHGGAVQVTSRHLVSAAQATITPAQAREMAAALVAAADEAERPG